MPFLQLPGLLILTRFSNNISTGIRYRSASNTKLYLPLIRFYSLPVHITFAISLPSSLHDPLGHRHWSLSFTHKLSRVSKSLTALFGMRHLTYGTNFLHLFAFLYCQMTTSECSPPLPGSDSAPKSVTGGWRVSLVGEPKKTKKRKEGRKTPKQWQTGYSPRPPTSSDQNQTLHGGWPAACSHTCQV